MPLSETDILKVIRDKFQSYPTIEAACADLGVTRQHYYDVVNSRGRHPGPALLKAIGYKRTEKYSYEPIPDSE